jgi:hypothetical protein
MGKSADFGATDYWRMPGCQYHSVLPYPVQGYFLGGKMDIASGSNWITASGPNWIIGGILAGVMFLIVKEIIRHRNSR